MTSLLEKAFQAASRLPTLERNILARTLLDEIESEEKWADLFADSEDVLAQQRTLRQGRGLQGKRQGKRGQAHFLLQ
jgi:hypothetical protein